MEWVGRWPTSWDGHLALVYDDEDQRRAGVAAWVRRGLDVAAKILYTEPAQEPPERSFVALLEEHGIGVDAAVERGQLQVFPASAQAYSPAWQASVVEEALASGYPSVRWSGEAATAWGVMSPATHSDIEQATDDLCDSGAVSILCQYPSDLSPATWQTVVWTHRGGVTDSLLRVSQVLGGLGLAGEVDASNVRALSAVLVAIGAWLAGTDLVLDLGGLAFMDLAGVRALLGATAAFRDGGGRVRLRAPQQQVAKVFAALGVDASTGCRIERAP